MRPLPRYRRVWIYVRNSFLYVVPPSLFCRHKNLYFDRSMCWDCHGMHYYCLNCYKRLGKCQ